MVGSGEAIWSFNDEDEEEEADPYTFLLKPNMPMPYPSVSRRDTARGGLLIEAEASLDHLRVIRTELLCGVAENIAIVRSE